VLCEDTLVKDILEGRIKGKKKSGRPRYITLDWMKTELVYISEFERDGAVSNVELQGGPN